MKSCTLLALTLLSLLPSVVAWADAQEDQSACMMDAQTYCGQFIPDRVRVAHCLMANRHRITPACREAIKRFK